MSAIFELWSMTSQEGDVRDDQHDDAGKDMLTTAEVRAALDALKPADEVRLLRGAQFFSEINGFDDASGLLQEALIRALEGTRRCPRDLPLMPFLFGVIRSIANSVSKSAVRSPINRFAEVDEAEDQEHDEGIETVQHITPERVVAAQEMLQKVNDMFKDDADVLMVLYAMAEGLQGQDLRDALGLTETQHNTIRRRMMRQSKSLAEAWRQK